MSSSGKKLAEGEYERIRKVYMQRGRVARRGEMSKRQLTARAWGNWEERKSPIKRKSGRRKDGWMVENSWSLRKSRRK